MSRFGKGFIYRQPPPTIIPITYNGGQGGFTAGATSLQSPVGSPAYTAGEMLICMISWKGNPSGISVNNGWSILSTKTQSGFVSCFAAKVADGIADRATFSWTGSISAEIGVFRYSGVKAASPIGDSEFDNANGSSVSLASLTMVGASSLVAAFYMANGLKTPMTFPGAPWTVDVNGPTGGDGYSFSVLHRTLVSAGDATGNTAISWSGNIAWSFGAIELINASANP